MRLDRDGRVYKELRDGTPVPLPHCGGGILLALLIMATAGFDHGLPATIRIPVVARRQCTIDELPDLADVLEYVSRDLGDVVEAFERAEAAPTHIPL